MEQSTIIKLRQAESRSVKQNGSYSITLKEGVKIEQGDVVKLHTAIIDTATESFVTLDEDTTIIMDVANYFRNYKTNSPLTQVFNPIVPASQPDLELYFPCVETSATGNEYIIDKITVFGLHDLTSRKTEEMVVEFEYEDIVTGGATRGTVTIPPFASISHAVRGLEVPIKQVCRGKNARITSSNYDFRVHRIADGSTSQPKPALGYGNGGNPISPTSTSLTKVFTRRLEFIIPSGRYLPNEIATILTDEMAKIDTLGTVGYELNDTDKRYTYPVESPFMTTFHQMNQLVNGETTGETPPGLGLPLVYTGTVPTENDQPTTFMTIDTSTLTSFTDPVLGANEISLNYDDTLKKLNFDALHFPFYVAATAPAQGGLPGCIYPQATTSGGTTLYLQPNPAEGAEGHNTPIPTIPIQSYGGCFFTNLEPASFWVNQLGFTNIVVQPKSGIAPVTRSGGKDGLIPVTVVLEEGKNIVASYRGLDNIIPKNNLAFVPILGEVSTALTTPIISSREFNTPVNDDGYYLIEVGVGLTQKLIGGALNTITTSNKVQSIMGKYYTAGNYLQQQGQGEIVYQHIGEPVVLTELEVNVRNGDMTLPTENDIGGKNTIFLEVVKQVPVAEPTKP